MTVELALCIPVLLAVVGIVVNLMLYLDACARFDRVAAEAVRIEAVAPQSGSYSSQARAQAVERLLRETFAGQKTVSITVSIGAAGTSSQGDTGGEGISIPFLPRQETYHCVLSYRPWGFGDSFFGIRFNGLEHRRDFVIDAFTPGLLP
jgi:hypothetical protein